jgi:hypothetical protein
MSKISTYDVAPVPKLADKLIGTSVGGTPDDGTYNFTLQELLTLFLPNIPANNLQGILDYGNTAIQDINLTGTIYTTDLDVSSIATILDSFLTGDTHISGGLFDVNTSIGTAGQVLTSTGFNVEWYTIPTVIPDLQQVLTAGNTSTLDIILTSNLSALDVSSDTATFSTDLTIDGTLTDGTASVGTAGKVLSSTGTGVQWVSLPVYSATSPLFFDSITGIFSIQVANGTQDGYLTSADWITFNGKQNAGNYITALTGEATATGPGSVAITLSNTAVIGKILTGLSITGSTIAATDTILQAFGKAQNQINGKQDTITLTTTGTSGAATLIGATLNIPQYTDAFVGTVTSVAALTLGTVGTDLSSTVANSTTTPVITLNVPTASAANRGALSAADWTTFNSKQIAGNYITSLTGEATASGPGASAITLTNSAVIAKVLTGLNVTGGTVIAADTILAAFGKVQNQINGLIGGSIFQGVWNASTNTPALVSSVGTNGYYYIVSVAGSTNLDGITDWQVGDWAIFAGTSWQKVDNTDAVSSVNGFTGAVSLTTDNIAEGATNLYFTNTRARTAISLTTTGSSGASTYNSGTGVFNIPTYTDAFVGTVTSVGLSSATSGVTIGSTPITTSGTITIAIATATSLLNGLLSSTDWTTFNNKQGTITLTTTGTSGAATFVANTLNIPNYADGGVLSLSAIGSTPNANAATITGTVLNLQPADASFGGVVTTGIQTFGGAKTFNVDIIVNSIIIGKGSGNIIYNTVVGGDVLFSNTTGNYNTVSGFQALYNNLGGDYNTSKGFQSMFSNTNGSSNTSVGANSLPSNTLGNNNTAIGRYAGYGTGSPFNNTTGSNNIFIGYQSAGISATESNRTWIGNSSTLATWVGGNLLVGTTANSTFALDVTGTARITGQITLGSTITDGTYTYTLPGATGTLALVGGAGVGTVTSVAAITLGTTGTDLSSTVANGTTTPVITLQVPTASASNRGALSSADWSTFNSKQGTITLTTTGTSGAATFVANTLNIPNYADGGVLSLSAIGGTANANAATITGTVLKSTTCIGKFGGGVITTGTQTFAGAKTLTGTLYGIGLSMTGTTADIVQGTATSGKALRGTATTGYGLYASVTSGQAVYAESTGTGGSAINGTAGNGIGGYFLNNATGFATLYVTNNGSGNLANFNNSAGTKFTINNAGNLGNGTYTYTLPSATGTLALTSALTGYLPLTGGTLTGNANFQLTNAASPSISIRRSSSSYDATINYNDNGSSRWTVGLFGDSTADYKFYNANSGANSIKIGYGTDLVTLAGALSGTSASFTGGLTVNNPSSSSPLELNNTVTSNYLFINSPVSLEAMTRYYNPTAGNWYTGIRASAGLGSTSSYHIFSGTYTADVAVFNTDGTSKFAGALSGTSATFSSSVTATSFSNAGLQSGEVFNGTKSNAGYFVGYLQNTSATGLGLYIQNGSDTNDAIRIGNAAGSANNIQLVTY